VSTILINHTKSSVSGDHKLWLINRLPSCVLMLAKPHSLTMNLIWHYFEEQITEKFGAMFSRSGATVACK